MSQAVVVTGATGFLGSHLVAGLLGKPSSKYVICLARPKDGRGARDRVVGAVSRAFEERDAALKPSFWLDRVVIVEDDLVAGSLAGGDGSFGAIQSYHIEDFWHCAACTDLSNFDERKIWEINSGGLRNALDCATFLKVTSFNYISTSYVSGTSSGRIFESGDVRPPGFNNAYEESKYLGEGVVARRCRVSGIGYRIFRPSILIGHSRTFRTSSHSGLYHVVRLLKRFREAVLARDPIYFDRLVPRLQVDREGVLNLIPVDIAVAEMLDLSARGVRSMGQTFHITCESPISTCDAFQTTFSALGIKRTDIVGPDAKLSSNDRILLRALRFFLPYVNSRKIFDRSHVFMHGCDHHQSQFIMDVNRLRSFVNYYIVSLGYMDSVPEEGGDRASFASLPGEHWFP
jgi:nucleoside-diphosphate-sugar epimerase